MKLNLNEDLPKTIPLSNQYTRTYYQEDSFVANIRRALPRFVSAFTMEGSVFPKLSPEESQFVTQFYERKEHPAGDYYQLKTIPVRIRKETAIRLLGEVELAEEDKQFLESLYTWSESLERYVLKEVVTEAEEIRALQLMKRKDYYITNVEKAVLSHLLESISEIPKRDVFFANLFVPTTHKFFSPPNLKHISGMQIVETARQFGIAINHMYGKVPFEDVTFLLLYLNSEFLQYAKINMPIKLRCYAKEVKYSKQGYWNYSDLEITVYQENQEIARIKMAASILPLKVYKRLKSTQEDVYEIDPRFRVLDKFKNNLSIRFAEKNLVSTLENISTSGFMIKTNRFYPGDLVGQTGIVFFMHFDIVGFVHGTCRLLWVREDDNNEDTFFAGFQFDSLSELDKTNVKEAINRYGRLIEEREIQ